MFASFFNMFDPAKIFLESVFNLIHYNKSTYNLDELLKQLSAKNECEMSNCTVDVAEVNKKIHLKKFFVQNILVKKSNFFFKKLSFANEKTKLFFNDIIVDIYQKKIEDEKKEEIKVEEEKKSGGFLNNVVNVVIQNLEIFVKNITIKFYDKENKNVDYALLIRNISFKEAKDVKQIEAKDKGKYLFIHNKAVYIEGVLFKEKYEENDNIFFEEKNENFIKNKQSILYIKNEVEFDIFHDKDNSMLTIGNLKTNFILENILDIKQINSFYKYFIEEEEEKNDIEKVEEKPKIKNNDDIDLMGFKIKKLNFEIKIDLLYAILFDEDKNEKIKEKNWISMEENIKDFSNGTNTKNKIIEQFNLYQTKYYIFCLNNLLIKLKNKIFVIDNLSIDLNTCDNIKEEKENNINNIIINDEIEIKDNNNLINYLQISKLSYDSEKNELKYGNIYFELNDHILGLLKLLPKNSSNKSQVNNNIINKEPEIENNVISTSEKKEINNDENILIEKEKEKFKINGKDFNIKIYLNENIKDTIESLALKDIFNRNKNNTYINFELSNFNLYNNNIYYDKIDLTYNDLESKKSYYIVKLVDKQNTSRIENGQNEEINIFLDYELYIFINPKLIKQILDYTQKISELINKNKEEKNINKNISLNKDNNNCIHQCLKNNINFGINISSIKLVLTENSENNSKIINLDKNALEGLPLNEIIFSEEDNNYIIFNFDKINFKLEQKDSISNINFTLKSLIIEDNISNSKYKILLSNYYFKNINEIFMNIETKIFFNDDLKKLEITPTLKIAPIAIYLDQISLYYIYNIFNQIKIKEENNNIENKNINIIINSEEEELEINNNEGNYIISNFEVQKFFIELNYSTNKEAKNTEIINSKITTLLNTTSINKLKIIFQNPPSIENTKLPPKEFFTKIYEYYSSDLVQQISGSLISALPLFYHIKESIDGSLDIVREPYDKYTKNESVMDGLVKGTMSWVVKTATMFTYLGESIGNFFSFKACMGNDDNYSSCRQLRHKFNQSNKEQEEYYLK